MTPPRRDDTDAEFGPVEPGDFNRAATQKTLAIFEMKRQLAELEAEKNAVREQLQEHYRHSKKHHIAQWSTSGLGALSTLALAALTLLGDHLPIASKQDVDEINKKLASITEAIEAMQRDVTTVKGQRCVRR